MTDKEYYKKLYTLDKVVKKLKKEGSTTEDFLESYKKMNQSQLACKYHMQKWEVGYALKFLGVDSSQVKKNKIAENTRNAAAVKREKILAEFLSKTGLDIDEILQEYKIFGAESVDEKFGAGTAKVIKRCFPDVKCVHSSIMAHEKNVRDLVENKVDEISELLSRGYSLHRIAKELNCYPFALTDAMDRLGLEYSGESPEVIQERARNGAVAGSEKRNAQYREAYQLHHDEIVEKIITQLIHPKDFSKDYGIPAFKMVNFLEEEGYDFPSRQILALIRSIEIPSDEDTVRSMVSFFKDTGLEIPKLFVPQYQVQYMVYTLLKSPALISELSQVHGITTAKEFGRRFCPGYAYSTVAGHTLSVDFPIEEPAPSWKNIFPDEDDESLVKKKISSMVDEYDSSLMMAAALNTTQYLLLKVIKELGVRHRWKVSQYEEKLLAVLEEWDVDYKIHQRGVIGSMEVDFYIPEVNLAIEVNPTHTHNADYGFLEKHQPRSPGYHKKKFTLARDNNVSLLQLYEKDLVEPCWSSVTLPHLKFKIFGAEKVLFARQTRFVHLSSRSERFMARDFLTKYHQQGAGRASKYCALIGDSDEFVAVASFSPTTESGTWELVRLCFAPGVQVRYGLSKIVSNFFKSFPNVDKLTTFSRNDMGFGDGYAAAGFTEVLVTQPNLTFVNPHDPNDSYSWSIAAPWSSTNGVVSRYFGSAQRSKGEILNLIRDELPHRSDNGRGYVRVYGAGSTKWIIGRPS